MSKCRVSYKINNDTYNSLGIIKDNRITFMENDIKFILKYDENNINITRENSEYKINLKLGDDSSCTYELKDQMYKKMIMKVETKSLDVKNNEIRAKYKLEEVLFNLCLTYEVIE